MATQIEGHWRLRKATSRQSFPPGFPPELAEQLEDPKWLADAIERHRTRKKKKRKTEPLALANKALDALFRDEHGFRDIPDRDLMTDAELHKRVSKWLVDPEQNGKKIRKISKDTVRRAAGRGNK
jgi:hypothetical protein